MGFGVYILLNVLFYFLALRFRPGIRRQGKIWAFTGQSMFVSFICLVLFLALSVGLDVMRIGAPQNFNLPQDYLEFGVVGWAVLLVGLAGILTPVWLALIFNERALLKK